MTALLIGNPATALTVGVSGSQNITRASLSSCPAPYCSNSYGDTTYSVETWGAESTIGTNTYENPAFTNTADLLANQLGVPNCSSFVNTTDCMGWNANTSTLRTPSIISDLIATAVGSSPYYSATAGKGYQLPSTTCAPNADYPTWLKGIVYLQWSGTSLTENSGLVTKPCNM